MEMILVARKKRDFHLGLIKEANRKKKKKDKMMQILKSKSTFNGESNLITQRFRHTSTFM